MGENEPWYSVITKYGKGQIPEEDKLAFYEHDVYQNIWQRTQEVAGRQFNLSNRVGVDFGCGLGRISQSMARSVDKVYCVDQSWPHLNLAKKELIHFFPTIAPRITFLWSDPHLLEHVPEQVDQVFSVITLQHMVSPLAIIYIEQLCDVLKVGGYGLFQIPDSIAEHHSCNWSNYERRAPMEMWPVPAEEVRQHLELRGCKVWGDYEYDMIGDAGTSRVYAFHKEKEIC